MDRHTKKKRISKAIGSIYALIIFLFIYAPVAVMIVYSFNDSRANVVWRGFTTKWYVKLFQDAELWKIFGTTLLVAVIASVIGVVLGTMGAVGLKDAKFKGN